MRDETIKELLDSLHDLYNHAPSEGTIPGKVDRFQKALAKADEEYEKYSTVLSISRDDIISTRCDKKSCKPCSDIKEEVGLWSHDELSQFAGKLQSALVNDSYWNTIRILMDEFLPKE